MERRREHRVAVKGTGKVSWLEGLIMREEFMRVENVASDGLQIRLLTPLPKMQMVRITGLDRQCRALVRYCHLEGKGWTIGLQLAGASSTRPPDYGSRN